MVKHWDEDGPTTRSGESTMEWYDRQMRDPTIISNHDLDAALAEWQTRALRAAGIPESYPGEHRATQQHIDILVRVIADRSDP